MGYGSFKTLENKYFLIKKIIQFLGLFKPGIILGNLITFLGGFFLITKKNYSSNLLYSSILGIVLVIGSSCLFNNIFDCDIDIYMQRTKNRFLCFHNSKFLIFYLYIVSFFMLFLGFFILYKYVNYISAIISMIGFIVYIIIYTVYLKRRSVYSTIIGSISGSIPPIIGYVSANDKLDVFCLILFFIFSFWQIAHFYSISIFRMIDYKKAKIPVISILYGITYTKNEIIFNIFGLMFSNFLFFVLECVGLFYFYITNLSILFWLIFSIYGLSIYSIRIWSKIMFFLSILVIFLESSLMYF